jgi:hypothetical protein
LSHAATDLVAQGCQLDAQDIEDGGAPVLHSQRLRGVELQQLVHLR